MKLTNSHDYVIRLDINLGKFKTLQLRQLTNVVTLYECHLHGWGNNPNNGRKQRNHKGAKTDIRKNFDNITISSL